MSEVVWVGLFVLAGTIVSAVVPVIGVRLNSQQHGDAIRAIKELGEDQRDTRAEVRELHGEMREMRAEINELRDIDAEHHRENSERLAHLEAQGGPQ